VTAEIVELDVVTFLDIPVERVLRKAGEADLETVIVLGWRVDGSPYFASSIADGPETLWLLELTKLRLMKKSVAIADGDD
jgi:hypothetical protein